MKYILIVALFVTIVFSIKAQNMSIFLLANDSGWYPSFLKPVVEVIHQDSSTATSILDIGTGPGKLPEMLIERDSSLKIIGIDIDTTMIDEARKRLIHHNVSFEYQAINTPIAFANEKFDVVTFCSVLFLLDDSTKTLLVNEAKRVLKPGGKIIILTPTGNKPILAFWEVWKFPFSINNWTYIVWKTVTANAGRRWQKQKWVSMYSIENNMNYSTINKFNNNVSVEILTLTK